MRDRWEYLFLPVLAIILGVLIIYTGHTNFGAGNRIGPNNIYPTAIGVPNPNVNQGNINQTICVKGWTATIRPPATYTTTLKIQQLKKLGYSDQNPADYEEDHVISLELGGNPTDPNNLDPEPYNASIPDGGARMKDHVENYLKSQVCGGKMTLLEAQNLIVSDWYAVYQKIKNQFGAGIPQATDEDDN